MEANRKTARIAGLLFLLMVVAGLFAELFFRQKLVATDAATTAQNILNNPLLLRAGVLSDIVMSLSYLFTALALYRLLRSVDRDLASLMVLFAAAGSVILLSRHFDLRSDYAAILLIGILLLGLSLSTILRQSTLLVPLLAGMMLKNFSERPGAWPRQFGTAGGLLILMLFVTTGAAWSPQVVAVGGMMASFPHVKERVQHWETEVAHSQAVTDALLSIEGTKVLSDYPRQHTLTRVDTRGSFDKVAEHHKKRGYFLSSDMKKRGITGVIPGSTKVWKFNTFGLTAKQIRHVGESFVEVARENGLNII